MRTKNIVLTAVLAAGAGALATVGFIKNKELMKDAKEKGKKVYEDVKDLGVTVKSAVKVAADDVKDKANEIYNKVTTEETEETETEETETEATETEETEEIE